MNKYVLTICAFRSDEPKIRFSLCRYGGASETRARVKITSREKGETQILEEKMKTTRSLVFTLNRLL